MTCDLGQQWSRGILKCLSKTLCSEILVLCVVLRHPIYYFFTSKTRSTLEKKNTQKRRELFWNWERGQGIAWGNCLYTQKRKKCKPLMIFRGGDFSNQQSCLQNGREIRTQGIVRMYYDTPSFLCFQICYLYLWSISTISALSCCSLSSLSFSYFSQYFNFSSSYHLLLLSLSYLTHIALTFYFKLTGNVWSLRWAWMTKD